MAARAVGGGCHAEQKIQTQMQTQFEMINNPLTHSVPLFESQATARKLLVSGFATPNTPSTGF
jgi:hypothetical protein